MDTYVLKLVKSEITHSITHIVNLSIQTSDFPNIWKQAEIIPLFKPGEEDQLSPKLYCPVEMLPVASKLLERVVLLQIVEFMETRVLRTDEKSSK